jgi:FkbM family methyltransferase
VGGYAVGQASRFGIVVAVEPSEEARRILLKNAELNGLQNLRVIPKAVSTNPGPVKLYHARRLVNYSLAHPSETYTLVDTTSLDDLLAAHDSVDTLKIDVEGAEMDVIESGLKYISRVKNVIIEVRSQYEARIVRLMSERGFSFQVLEDRSHIGEKNILFVRGSEGGSSR